MRRLRKSKNSEKQLTKEQYLRTLRDLIYDWKFKEAQALKDKIFEEAINKKRIK